MEETLYDQTILKRLGTLRDGPLKRRRLLTFLAPLTLLGLVICICMGPAPVDGDVYLLIDDQETYTVTADSDLDYQSEALYTPAPITPVPQMCSSFCPKGRKCSSPPWGGTSAAAKSSGPETKLLSASLSGSAEDDTADTGVVTTRHETVANLLRRSHVKVADDEMVVVDLTADTPSITVCRQYTRLRNVQVQTDFAEGGLPIL